MQLTLVSVYEKVDAIETLYRLLEEREPDQNISHKRMPSMAQHKAFVKSEPYLEWHLIQPVEADVYVGAIYLTRNCEVGLFIFKAHQHKGYGTSALKLMRLRYPKMKMLANIAPRNNASIAFFSQNGFKLLQETYELQL